MPLIGTLVQFTPLTTIKSSEVNSNLSAIQSAFNNSAVLTDAARTVTVSHTFSAPQTMNGILFGTDNATDIGAVAASRPRTVYVATSVIVPTVTATTLAGTLSTAAQANVTSLGTLTRLAVSNAAAAGQYGVSVTGSAGAARDLLIVGQAGYSNGFTVQYNGAAMVYGMANGGLTVGGTVVSTGLNTGDINLSRSSNTAAIFLGSDGNCWFYRGDTSINVVLPGGTSTVFSANALSTGVITAQGLIMAADNSYDIGAAAASRPRNVYVAGSIFSASSRELKQAIEPTRVDALDLVRRTRIVDFRYKASPDRPKIGFIAEDTDELLSGPTRREFDLNNAVGILLRAVQQLERRLELVEGDLGRAA